MKGEDKVATHPTTLNWLKALFFPSLEASRKMENTRKKRPELLLIVFIKYNLKIKCGVKELITIPSSSFIQAMVQLVVE